MGSPQQNWNEDDLVNNVEIHIKFQKACKQVVLMNNQVKEISTRRYKRVVRDSLRNYRYLLRLRLCTAEGLRNMYHEYSCRQAEKIADLEENLREIGVEPIYIDPEY